MSEDQDVLSERLDNLVDMFKEHRADSKAFMTSTSITLANIREQTTKTNGRVSTLEAVQDAHARELGALRASGVTPKAAEPHGEDQPLTRRDLSVAVGTGIVLVGVILWLFMEFGPYLQRVPR